MSRGENIEGRDVPVLVPVSVRRPGERGVYNNQVSAMFPTLPVGTEDPVERLQSVRAQMDRLKESGQAVAGEVLTSLSGFAPPLLLALGGRLAARSPSLGVQTGVTNVPGPQQPLQTLGRRLLESFPFVPLIGNVRISIAIFSYNGGIYFGVTGDYDSSSDIDVLTAGVERGVRRVAQGEPAGPEPVAPTALVRSAAITRAQTSGSGRRYRSTPWHACHQRGRTRRRHPSATAVVVQAVRVLPPSMRNSAPVR